MKLSYWKDSKSLPELGTATTAADVAAEIGDLYELLDCLVLAKGATPQAGRAAQAKHKAKIGGFEDHLYVETITNRMMIHGPLTMLLVRNAFPKIPNGLPQVFLR